MNNYELHNHVKLAVLKSIQELVNKNIALIKISAYADGFAKANEEGRGFEYYAEQSKMAHDLLSNIGAQIKAGIKLVEANMKRPDECLLPDIKNYYMEDSYGLSFMADQHDKKITISWTGNGLGVRLARDTSIRYFDIKCDQKVIRKYLFRNDGINRLPYDKKAKAVSEIISYLMDRFLLSNSFTPMLGSSIERGVRLLEPKDGFIHDIIIQEVNYRYSRQGSFFRPFFNGLSSDFKYSHERDRNTKNFLKVGTGVSGIYAIELKKASKPNMWVDEKIRIIEYY